MAQQNLHAPDSKVWKASTRVEVVMQEVKTGWLDILGSTVPPALCPDQLLATKLVYRLSSSCKWTQGEHHHLASSWDNHTIPPQQTPVLDSEFSSLCPEWMELFI